MMKMFLKSILAAFLRGFAYLLPPFVGKEVVVLNYHSLDKDDWVYSLNPEVFEKQMKYLSENYQVVSVKDIIDYIDGKKDLPTKTAALTFDDGYANFLTDVLPILKKYNLPAAIFIVGSLSASAEDLNKETLLLDVDEVEILSEAGVTIGSHGLTHRSLNKLSPVKIEEELIESKKRLEKLTGQLVKYLAYPKGKFNETVISIAKKVGYEAAFSIKQGLIQRGGDKFAIKRVVIDRNQNMLIFKTRLTKAVDWWTRFWQFYH